MLKPLVLLFEIISYLLLFYFMGKLVFANTNTNTKVK